MIGIGSSNDALLQQRGKVIAIEMDAELLDPTQQLNRPRLLVVIEKKRLMCTTHSASLFASSLTAGGYSRLIRW